MEKLFEVNGKQSKYPLDLDLLDENAKENEYYLIKGDVKEKITLSDMINNQVEIISKETYENLEKLNHSKLSASGDYSKLSASGNYSKLSASGNCSKLSASGDYSKLSTSGDDSKLDIGGDNSIGFNCGFKGVVKAKKGTWISLAEYEIKDNKYIPCFALSAQIENENYVDNNGNVLNENNYYCLYDKKFHVVDLSDGIETIVLKEKTANGITVISGITMSEYREIYIVKNDYISSHGETIKKAKEDFKFKLKSLEDKEQIIEKIKETQKVTREDYRNLTGACEFGVEDFCNRHNIKDDETEVELSKVLTLLSDNDYGSKEFKKYFI